MKNNRITRLMIFLLFIELVACSREAKQNSSDLADGNVITLNDSSLSLMGVRLARAETKVIQSRVYMNGKVVALPNYKASVSTDLEGKIDNIFIREGVWVKKGQALFTLRSMALIELQSQYIEAKSENDFLSIEFKRQQELISSNVGALVNYQTTEAKYKAAQSKVNALKAKLKLLGISAEGLDEPGRSEISSSITIKAPIDGYVFKLAVQVGQLATTDIILAELINTDRLMADIYLYDNDLDDVHEGQLVEINFINHKYSAVVGKVEHLAHSFDSETRAVTAHVSFPVPTGEMVLPDMTVRCALIKEESTIPQLTVPIAAILEEGDYQFVFLAFPGEKQAGQSRLHKYRVTLGNRNDREVQIKFSNTPTTDFQVVVNNSQIIEAERRRLSGTNNSLKM